MEVICITNKIDAKKQPKPNESQQAKNSFGIGESVKSSINQTIQTNLKFEVSEIERAIYAQIVKKCGNRSHWEEWANDISSIAKNHIARINSILFREEVVAFASKACKLHEEEGSFFKVEKMKFAKTGKEIDKSKIIYNHKITVENIPLEAYEYVVNGKPAIEWVMERQGISIHKESGIKNDANLFATETMQNAKYPLELLLQVINVSLKTIKIVQSLPKLEI